jgi:hypothetical protein
MLASSGSPSSRRTSRALASPVDAGAPSQCDGPPSDAARLLAPQAVGVLEGWIEHGTELPSLQHARLFGLRRVFRVYLRGEERALLSQLVSIDAEGRPHTSCVVGELEMLSVGPAGARWGRVWELDREALAGGAEQSRREVDAVSHVPGLGADRFLLEETSPIPLAKIPCRRCHDDEGLLSLPSREIPIAPRIDAILGQFVVPWHASR